MTEKDKQKECALKQATSIFVLTNILIIVAGLAMVHASHDLSEGIFKTVVDEFGKALLIAALLACTAEYFTRQREAAHRHELSVNLLTAVFKRSVPDRVFDEVQRELLGADFYRKNVNVRFTIRDMHEYSSEVPENVFVVVKEDVYYDLENVSSIEQEVVVKVSSPTIENFTNLNRFIHARIGDDELTRAKLDAATTVGKSDVSFHYVVKSKLKPGTSITCRVVTQYARYARDEMSRIAMLPEDGVTLTLVDPGDKFKIEAESLHSQGLRRDCSPSERILQVFTLDYGVFPGNGAWWSWRPRDLPLTVKPQIVDDVMKKAQNELTTDALQSGNPKEPKAA